MPTNSKRNLDRLTTAWMPLDQKKYKDPSKPFPPESKLHNAEEIEKRKKQTWVEEPVIDKCSSQKILTKTIVDFCTKEDKRWKEFKKNESK